MHHFVYHFRTDKNKLDEMLFLRATGWSYTALAEHFNCPKLTIRWLSRKNGLDRDTVTVRFNRQDYIRTTVPFIKVSTIQTYPEERISQGKTYAEYLKEDKERRLRKLHEYNPVTLS